MRCAISIMVLGLCATGAPLVAQEKAMGNDPLKAANELNTLKQMKVSGTLSTVSAILDPRLELLKRCGDQGFFANWSTQSCHTF